MTRRIKKAQHKKAVARAFRRKSPFPIFKLAYLKELAQRVDVQLTRNNIIPPGMSETCCTYPSFREFKDVPNNQMSRISGEETAFMERADSILHADDSHRAKYGLTLHGVHAYAQVLKEEAITKRAMELMIGI